MNETKTEEGVTQGFDYRSTIQDPKTGKLIKEQHYKRYVSAVHGEFIEQHGKYYAINGNEIQDPRAPKTAAPEEVKTEKVKISFTQKT